MKPRCAASSMRRRSDLPRASSRVRLCVLLPSSPGSLTMATKMRVLPIVTRGPFENVYDLLYVRGIDAAIIYGDVLEHFKKDPRIPTSNNAFISLPTCSPPKCTCLSVQKSRALEDLAGKPVNFNTHGTAAAYSGPIIFERLGIKVEPHFSPSGCACRNGQE